MANFPPLKNYLIYCLDKLIERHNLQSPFLDVGCGVGDISSHLAARGFSGTAVDESSAAIGCANGNLKNFRNIKVEHKQLCDITGLYKTVLLMDVLEHMHDDVCALVKVNALLDVGGYLVLALPSNPREWRWDDVLYGHYRRYAREDIESKLIQTGFSPVECWDFTYPVFWLMRRMYTRMKKDTAVKDDKLANTAASSVTNAWCVPGFLKFFTRKSFLWDFVNATQFFCFKNMLVRGHEMIVLAKKAPL